MMPQTTMDFFAREEDAQRATRRLGWLFALAVLATVATINLVSGYLLNAYLAHQGDLAGIRHHGWGAAAAPLDPEQVRILRLEVHAGVTLVTMAIIALGSIWKMAELSGGGAVVASALGGRALAREGHDARERMLLNVVEEMAIASGVPLPQVFVLDHEDGINAFAAGTDPGNAVVAVTRGALEQLSRDELQGVIGHEFSHILHGDTRINLRLMGLVHGILVIGLAGALLIRLGSTPVRSTENGRNPVALLVLIGIAVYAIGYIGFFFGGLIKAAISRQREYLADASSVQFTRNPAGLAGALKLLGAGYGRARLAHANAHEASHFLFGDGVGGSWLDLLATHPPLEERIRAIEPQWDGTYPERARQPGMEAEEPAPPAAMRQRPPAVALAPHEVVARIGTVSPEHVAFGAQLLASIPAALQQAAKEAYSARALCLCLLLDGDADRGQAGLAAIAADDPALARAAQQLLPEVAARGAPAHLPLLDLCLPALRLLSSAQRRAFLRLVAALQAGRSGRMRTYCIATLLRTRLDEQPSAPGGSAMQSVQPLWPQLHVLLSALARAGIASGDGAAGGDEREAVTALRAAAGRLLPDGGAAELLGAEACADGPLDAALAAIGRAAPGVKRRIVTACAWCVAADGVVTVDEAELLRVVCSCLGCPLPLFAAPA